MSLRLALAILVAALLGLGPGESAAELTRKPVAKIWPGYSALALDAAGVPHVAYQSPDHRPWHAVRAGKKFASELVDDASDAGWSPALGVDAQGRVHMAYHAERTAPAYAQKLVHAFSDGGPWQVEEVDEGGYGTSLALDADDRAHLLYLGVSGVLRYAEQEDEGWELHDTGFAANSFRTTALALDADANAHACYVRNTGFGVDAYYATDAEGDWAESLLDTNGQLCSLALGAGGRPWVAVLTPEAVLLFHDDGMGFVEETVLDLASALPGATFGPDGLALALGPGDRPYLVATFFASMGGRGGEVQIFLAHDGEEWRAALLGTKDEGFDPVLAVGPDGTLHGIWRSGGAERAKLSYFTATFPDLAGAWSGVAAGEGVVTGSLTVANEGNARSKGAPIALWLSSDALLDPADTPLPAKKKVGGIAPGAARTVAIEVEVAAPASGQHLIAVIDPEKTLDDLDRSDNTVAAPIP